MFAKFCLNTTLPVLIKTMLLSFLSKFSVKCSTKESKSSKKFITRGYFRSEESKCFDNFKCFAKILVKVLVATALLAGTFLNDFSIVKNLYFELTLRLSIQIEKFLICLDS